ncbi:CHAP domain-containing protein [Sphingobacterium yanglingense]|nr:CHAP domain-containing protein [Sphingobacterium yanglingense]
MATMYSLFLGFLLNALCSDSGSGSSNVGASMPAQGIFVLLDQNEAKNQGLVARLNCLLISGNKTNSLRSDKSDCLSEIIDNSLRLAQPRPFYLGSANSSICTISKNVAFDIFKKLKGEAQSIVLKISSDEFWTLLRSKVSRPSGMEDRDNIIKIASAELGVREATGNNDGPRVEEYLRYTNLGKGYEWCAAFVSWCYGQAGLSAPRNPWSPALFPKARSYKETDRVQSADLFGIYSARLKRIHHVGLVKERQGQYILTVEGNSNDRVESRRRHVNTVYRYADWVN